MVRLLYEPEIVEYMRYLESVIFIYVVASTIVLEAGWSIYDALISLVKLYSPL